MAAAAPAKSKPKKAAKKTVKKKKKAKGRLKSGRAAAPAEMLDTTELAAGHIENANQKSPIELLASYKETINAGDLETAAVVLRLVLNERPTHEALVGVNDLLGVTLDTQDTEVLIEIARTQRAEAVVKDVAGKTAQPPASPLRERIHAAHAAIEAAPRSATLEALATYKRAINAENPEAAALALAGAVRRPLDAKTVDMANGLLGIDSIIPSDQIVAQVVPTH